MSGSGPPNDRHAVAAATASPETETIYVEDGERVYPCRCGETHRGDDAAYDFGHHNCFHDEPLLLIEGLAPDLCCGLCGEVFHIWEVVA